MSNQHTTPRMLPLLVSGSLILAVTVLASLLLGAGEISPARAWAALWGYGSDEALFVLYELRGPRTLIGALVGVALGCAGALMQAVSRNPLAEPGLLGVSAGSSFAVALALVLGASISTLTVFVAQAGALVGCALVMTAARLNGLGHNPVRLILAGATLTSLLMALTSLLLMFDQRSADEIRFWVIGSVAGRDMSQAIQVLPFIGVALGLLAFIARPLAALALGESVARGLGEKPARIRLISVLVVALLVGSATAIAGPIAFLGLVVPYIARHFTGPDIRRTLWLSAVIGPILLIAADTCSRLLAAPAEMPLGVMTALLGAPVLIVMIRARRMPLL
ncbi:FecCD family ABC transporter permease [Terasakiispira papahanaumokuakeensis]|nr:iron ABC transporter permease [Terasakiispira papahanaumokuakeensis]